MTGEKNKTILHAEDDPAHAAIIRMVIERSTLKVQLKIMGPRAFPEIRYNLDTTSCFVIREISRSLIHFFRAVTVTLLSSKNDYAHRS